MNEKNSLDAMINIATAFSRTVSVGKRFDGQYLVWIDHVYWQENEKDIMARGIHGFGESIESACEHFLKESRGRILFDLENERRYIAI